jgi:hypothetical protein
MQRIAAASSSEWTFQEFAAGVFSSQAPLTTPLYRLANPTTGGHLYTYEHAIIACLSSCSRRGSTVMAEITSSSTFSGCHLESIAAYVYPTQVCGSQPMFRLYNPPRSTIVIQVLSLPAVMKGFAHQCCTASADDKNTAKSTQGYTQDEGIPFYVLAA